MLQPPRRRIARLAAALAARRSACCCRPPPRPPPPTPWSCAPGRPRTSTPRTRSTPTLVVGLRGLPAHLQPADRVRQGRQAGPGLRRHVGALGRTRSTFHIRDGMKWSDGTPATSKDVCFSWGLALDAIADEANIGAGYLDPGSRTPASPRSSAPTTSTFIAYTDGPVRPHLPDLRADPARAHLGQVRLQEDRRGEVRSAARRAPARTLLAEWKTGQFARFVRNPNYWGKQGFADEVVLQFFPDARTRWSRRSSPASSTTPTT